MPAGKLRTHAEQGGNVIDLYTWTTPNGRKISIMLEECALDYVSHMVDLGKGEARSPEFLAVNPDGKIPAIVDHDGPGGRPFTLAESGAILMYLAEKTGRFLPADIAERYEVIQWLMFQMSAIGPVFGDLHHYYRTAPEPVPYAVARLNGQARRAYELLDRHLADHEYLARELSIADFGTFPWIARHEWHRVPLAEYPNVTRWYEAMWQRPAVQRGMIPD